VAKCASEKFSSSFEREPAPEYAPEPNQVLIFFSIELN